MLLAGIARTEAAARRAVLCRVWVFVSARLACI